MSLKIRRGLELNLPASPDDGELLYATDSNKLFVGFGGTANEISGGTGAGLIDIVDDTSPQLGGNLDVNGRSIISTANGNITIVPNGTGTISLPNTLNITSAGNIAKTGQLNISPTVSTIFGNDTTSVDGNVTITRNSYGAAPGTGFLFQQHHEVADAVNFTFFRSRGTALARTSVVNNDDIADITFISNDGIAGVGVGNITCQVDGVVSSGRIPGRFGFFLHDGITSGTDGLREVAQLNSAGTWKVNSIENISGATLSLTATTVSISGDMQINAQGDLRFADSDNSNYVAFQAPTTVTSNVTWTLPGTDGSGGQVLSTNGSGTLGWASPASTPSRIEFSGETAPLADTQTGNTAITGFKGYALYKIQVNHAAWVRIYTDVAARDADASRAEGDDPLPGAGVIAEIITTSADTIFLTPGVIGFNNESPVTNIIPVAVTNKSGSSTTITVTLTILQLEA
jgi:hypothetical protein